MIAKSGCQIVKLLVFSVFTIFGTYVSAFGQGSKISEAGFYQALHSGLDLAAPIPRSVVVVKKEFEKGRVYEETKETRGIISDTLFTVVHVITYRGKTTTTEAIAINGKLYCRENRGKWALSEEICIPMTISELPTAIEASFSVGETSEVAQKGKFYFQYRTHGPASKGVNKGKPQWYFEDKFWIDYEGRIVRCETRSGSLSSKSTLSTKEETYKYNPDGLKVVPPIKHSVEAL